MMESAEEFAASVIQAFEDDHLLSREALPVFIASELEQDRNATRLALLNELQSMVEDSTHEGWPLLTALTESALDLRAKYTQPAQPTRAPARGCPRCHDEEAQFLDGQCQTCGEPSK